MTRNNGYFSRKLFIIPILMGNAKVKKLWFKRTGRPLRDPEIRLNSFNSRIRKNGHMSKTTEVEV